MKKKITFIGYPTDNLVEVLHEGHEERSCGANEVPFPAFLLKSFRWTTGLLVQPVFENGCSLFGVGVIPNSVLQFPDTEVDWIIEHDPALNGKAVNLTILCPDDTEVEWMKDPF